MKNSSLNSLRYLEQNSWSHSLQYMNFFYNFFTFWNKLNRDVEQIKPSINAKIEDTWHPGESDASQFQIITVAICFIRSQLSCLANKLIVDKQRNTWVSFMNNHTWSHVMRWESRFIISRDRSIALNYAYRFGVIQPVVSVNMSYVHVSYRTVPIGIRILVERKRKSCEIPSHALSDNNISQ